MHGGGEAVGLIIVVAPIMLRVTVRIIILTARIIIRRIAVVLLQGRRRQTSEWK